MRSSKQIEIWGNLTSMVLLEITNPQQGHGHQHETPLVEPTKTAHVGLN